MLRIERTYTRDEIERYKRLGFVLKCGVVYDMELAGPQGADYILIDEKYDIPLLYKAAAECRARFDVCRVVIAEATHDHHLLGRRCYLTRRDSIRHFQIADMPTTGKVVGYNPAHNYQKRFYMIEFDDHRRGWYARDEFRVPRRK